MSSRARAAPARPPSRALSPSRWPAGGRRVLLTEVEDRQGIAQLFDSPPLPYEERKVASAPGGGEVYALAIDPEEALLDYLELFYGMRRAGRALKRFGVDRLRDHHRPRDARRAADRQGQGGGHPRTPQASRARSSTTRSCWTPRRPAGSPGSSTSTPRCASWPRSGPIRSQADSVMALLQVQQTAVHVVTVLEEMPVQETVDGVAGAARGRACRSAR